MIFFVNEPHFDIIKMHDDTVSYFLARTFIIQFETGRSKGRFVASRPYRAFAIGRAVTMTDTAPTGANRSFVIARVHGCCY